MKYKLVLLIFAFAIVGCVEDKVLEQTEIYRVPNSAFPIQVVSLKDGTRCAIFKSGISCDWKNK